MLEILQYDYMIRALLAGLLVAFCVPVVGSFLVARRYSLIADSLAHVSLAGVSIGLLAGVAPLLVALPVAVAGALLLEYLRQARRLGGDIGLAILMSAGLALAVVLANVANSPTIDFTSYLFGSITTTTSNDVWIILLAAVVTLAIVIRSYRSLLYIAFDEDSARIAGHKVTVLNYVLVALAAVTVVLSLRVVGGLLVSAVLVVPVVIASYWASSFLQTIVMAVVVASVAVILGLAAAFYAGLAAGGAITLTLIAMLILTLIWRK